MSLHFLGDMNQVQIADLLTRTNIAFLPIGPTEVHGTYLPTRTDWDIATEGTIRTAMKLDEMGIETAIAPTVNYAYNAALDTFPGNLTLRAETVTAIIEDICAALAKWGFTTVFVMSGHCEAANMDAIIKGTENAMKSNPKLNASLLKWTYMAPVQKPLECEHPEWDIHAGEFESSVVLRLHPELVDEQAMRALEPCWGAEEFLAAPAGSVTFKDCGGVLGYFGDPAKATIAKGEEVLEIWAEYAVNEVLEATGKKI